MGGGSALGTVVSIVSTLAGSALSGSSSKGSESALLQQQREERERARQQEAEERRKRQERLTDARDLADKRLGALSGRESTLATGGAGLLTRAQVQTGQLKEKLGQ